MQAVEVASQCLKPALAHGVSVHRPSVHTKLRGHRLKQPPQFAESFMMSRHVVPGQNVMGVGHGWQV